MDLQPCRRWSTVLFVVLCCLVPTWRGRAAEPEKAASGKLSLDGASAPAARPEGAAENEKSLREQTIYIPYEKLRKVFEKEGRGVFLPYEKYRELWQAAQDKRQAAAEPKPPVGAVITEIDNEATVAKDMVRVKAVLKIDVLVEGWREVPLRLGDAAITEATLNGQPARIVTATEGGYKLLVENPTKKTQTVELTLQYAKAIAKSPGQNSVSFEAPQAPVSRWRVRIPEPGVKVSLHPLIAATEAMSEAKPPANGPAPKPKAPEEKKAEASKPEETVVVAFVGAAPTVRIEWTPKAEGATGLEALATVQAEQQVSAHEGVIRTRTQLAYTISRAELRQLAIEVPADQKVVNVFDSNVRQWSVEPSGQAQKIVVQLFEPAKQSQNVLVELEKYSEENKLTTLQAPVVKALGVGRQQGVVVVQVAEGLRADVLRSGGLLQLDAAELPAALARTGWAYSYRYAAVPYDLQFSVEKVQPRILVDSLVEVDLQPDRLTLDVLAIYTVQRAGVFRLEWDVPAGFTVRQVAGRAAAGAQEVQVDTHHLEGKDKTRLIVNLGRKALGRVGLALQLQKDLREPDLMAPTGKAVQTAVLLPRVAPETAQRATGRAIVSAPESLRVNPGKVEGLRSISFTEALQGIAPAREQKAAGSRNVLAFAFTQEPANLALTAERRKPDVAITQLLAAQVKEGEIDYRATFFYKVQYSPIKSLRIDVPAELASQIRNRTAAIREKVLDPSPPDLAKGYVAWSLTGETELMGDGSIEFTWTTKLGDLEVGASVPVVAPRLVPRGVDRSWGQIVVGKVETIDIQDDPKRQSGLRPIDPQHDLMPGANVANGARAFEFHDDWTLTLMATRYQAEKIKHAVVERALLRMVVTRADKVAVQALYRMRSAEQRLEVRLPTDAKIDVQPRLNGVPVTLEVGQNQQFFVPLTGLQNDDRPFLLELRFTVPGDGRRLEYPDFPQDPAVHKVYLAAYLPDEAALVDKSGPWTEEFSWNWGAFGNWRPQPKMPESQLVSWITGDVPMTRGVDAFPTDGQMYLFSAVRPLPSADGALTLSRVNEKWLRGLVFAGLVLAGLVLLATRMTTRALAIGALFVALVLCGAFWPILSWQLLNGTLASAVAVVLVMWAGAFLVWTLPRRPRPPAAATVPPSEPAPAQSPFVGPSDAPSKGESAAREQGEEKGGQGHA